MKLSTKTLYSFRLMIYLADNGEDGNPIKLKEIAEKQGLPFKYLEQLVTSLKNAGLIRSIQGKRGGYVLAKPAEEIRAIDIVKASMGPIELINCISPIEKCEYKEYCASRKMWGLIETRIKDVLYEYTLADLSEKQMIEKFEKQTGREKSTLKCN